MTEHLHIIEPTLENETGHCYSFVSTLCNAAHNINISLWCGHKASIRFSTQIDIRRFFYRKIRKIQFLWLCRSLLKKPGRIFVSTATRTDLYLINLASAGKISPNKVFIYVHWFRPSTAKRKQLKKLASSQPDISIFTPTESVCEEFRAAGFARTQQVPYPISPKALCSTSEPVQSFSHVLYAGAARSDKGFNYVVDFVEFLAHKGNQTPVSVQTSSQHFEKMDEASCASLARLEKLRYPHLKCYYDTLQQAEYNALFDGAICLQLYSQQDFADRISGVTLDALSMGSPVVTLKGTWIARVVSEFSAGLVIESTDSDAVFAAVNEIMSNYEHYCRCAFKAGSELQKRNNVDFLFQELTA